MNTSDANQKLHEIAKEIAQYMDGWRYADEQSEHRAVLDGPDGKGVNIAWKGFDHERLTVYGRWPEPVQYGDRVYQFYPRERLVISVAATRAPASIATDIQRRLLPKYLPLWQEAVEARDVKLAEWEKLSKMIARLVQIPGVQEDREKGSVRFGNCSMLLYGSAEVYKDGTASLSICNLPFAVVCEVLERVLS